MVLVGVVGVGVVHVRSIHPVPDLHRVYALKIRDHSPPTVAGAYQL